MADPVLGYTKEELITAAILPIGYGSDEYVGDLKTHLSEIFDEGLLEVCGDFDWRFLHTEATLSLANESVSYNFINNSIYVDQIETIHITTSGLARRLHPDTYRKFKQEDPEGTNTGVPFRYAEWGEGIIVFDRILDQALSAKMLYKRSPAMVVADSDYPIVPRKYQRNLKNYVRWKIASDKSDRRAGQFAEEYAITLQKDKIRESSKLDLISGDNSGPYQPTMDDVLARVIG